MKRRIAIVVVSWTTACALAAPSWAQGTCSTAPPSSGADGGFTMSNGQIFGPDGQPFLAHGIDVMATNEPTVSQLESNFPGINFVRLAIYNYDSPASLQAYVNSLTSAGIVVELENHTNSNGGDAGGGQGTIFTGAQLQQEQSWYSSVASAFKSNPDVWFGTDNEPSDVDASGQTDVAALSAWQQTTYNSIRSTGNNNPIMLEINGAANNPSSFGQGYVASDYANMTNVIGDIHIYGWVSGDSTDQSYVSQNLAGDIAQTQTITTANGPLPVLIGEYGPATDGFNPDTNASQDIFAVESSDVGSAAWMWAEGAAGSDSLLNPDGSLSSYGQTVAAYIKASQNLCAPASGTTAIASAPSTTTAASTTSQSTTAASTPSASQSTPTATASANDSFIMGTTGTLTDANGNVWAITSNGQVSVNGVTDTSTSDASELAYVNGMIWAGNSNNIWWGTSGPNQTWGPSYGLGNPLPQTAASDSTTASPATTSASSDSQTASTASSSSGSSADTTTASSGSPINATASSTANPQQVVPVVASSGNVSSGNAAVNASQNTTQQVIPIVGGTTSGSFGATSTNLPITSAAYSNSTSTSGSGSDALTTLSNQSYGQTAIDTSESLGVNPASTAAIAQAESNFQNVNTACGCASATGPWQFTTGTFDQVSANNNLGYTSSDVTNPNDQATEAPYYLQQIASTISTATGSPATTLDAYGGWVFGPTTGAQIASASDSTPLSSIVSSQSLSNNGMSSWTVGDFRTAMTSRLGSAANQNVLTN